MIAFAQQSNQQKSNEWYTPSRYVEAARLVMNGIDLDPASCELANETVRAMRYYTIEDDGLSQPWRGKVWLNPPYAKIDNRSGIARWTDKLLPEYRARNVTEAILLVPGDHSASWFKVLWEFPICFVERNILFNLPKHLQTSKYPHMSHMFASVFVYLGPNEQKFVEIFQKFGRIARAIDTPAPRHTTLNLWEVKR